MLLLLPLRAAAAPENTIVSRSWGTIIWDDSTGSCAGTLAVASLVASSIDEQNGRDPIFVRAEIAKGRVGRLLAFVFLRRREAWTTRELDSGSCDELRRAVSVVVAMAYEMGLGEANSEEAVPPDAAATENGPAKTESQLESDAPRATRVAVQNAEPVEQAASNKPSPRTLLNFTAWLAPIVDIGTLPNPAFGAALRTGLGRGAWSVALTGLLLPAISGSVPDRVEGASIGAAGGGVHACVALPFGSAAWEPRACAGGAYGRYWATGFGSSDARSEDAAYATVEGAIQASVPLTRAFRLRASIDGA